MHSRKSVDVLRRLLLTALHAAMALAVFIVLVAANDDRTSGSSWSFLDYTALACLAPQLLTLTLLDALSGYSREWPQGFAVTYFAFFPASFVYVFLAERLQRPPPVAK
jgi:hypothetical protein